MSKPIFEPNIFAQTLQNFKRAFGLGWVAWAMNKFKLVVWLAIYQVTNYALLCTKILSDNLYHSISPKVKSTWYILIFFGLNLVILLKYFYGESINSSLYMNSCKANMCELFVLCIVNYMIGVAHLVFLFDIFLFVCPLIMDRALRVLHPDMWAWGVWWICLAHCIDSFPFKFLSFTFSLHIILCCSWLAKEFCLMQTHLLNGHKFKA